jgi:poly(A) polymerase
MTGEHPFVLLCRFAVLPIDSAMARKHTPAEARRAATAVVRRLRDAGHAAYFAGGCVRDELLGLDPTDYDVATEATPQRVGALFDRTNEVGAAFGVVLVTINRVSVEVATFRSDGPYSDARRPDRVTFSDPESDARRRDFTINALLLDPLAEENEAGVAAGMPSAGPAPAARVIDYVGGMADLQRRVLRAVGDPDQRLAEDHLRALRAVRLSARLGFQIEPATAAAIRRHATELRGLSRERIGEELRKMMGHPSRAIALQQLQELGLDAPVLDEAHAQAQLRVLSGLSPVTSYPTALAAWAVDRHAGPTAGSLSQDQVAGVSERWRAALSLSNEERFGLKAALNGLAILDQQWQELSVAGRKKAASSHWFRAAMHLVDSQDRTAGTTRASAIADAVAELAATPGGLAPDPFVTGDTLVALGHQPGKAFKRILDQVYDAQLEGRVRTNAEAIALAQELAKRWGV